MRAWEAGLLQPQLASQGFALSPEKAEGQVIPSSLLPSSTAHGGFHLVGGTELVSPHAPDRDLPPQEERLPRRPA